MTDERSRGVVDPSVLERLGDELGDLTVAHRIAALYLQLLDERVSRLSAACAEHDLEGALERVLTLKVTSATVGAVAVRCCAESIERWIRQEVPREHVCQLAECLERLRCAATQTLTLGLGQGRPLGSGA